jgi:hypothetical protein
MVYNFILPDIPFREALDSAFVSDGTKMKIFRDLP